MDFTDRWMLVLLLILPLCALGMRGSLAALVPVQAALCLFVRCLILLLLILAIAGLRFRWKSFDLAVVFLVDRSASISAEAGAEARAFIEKALPKKGAGDEVGIVGFASAAQVLQAPAPALKLARDWPELKGGNQTAISRALSFSSAIFPIGTTRRLVLLSDGHDTEGGAVETAQRLGSQGIEVFTVPLENPSRPEVLIEQVELPAQVKTGEPFDLTARLRSSIATTATAKLYQNQFLITEMPVTLKPGANSAVFRSLKTTDSFARYEVELIPAEDTLIENNRAQGTVSLRGDPRVLIIDRDPQKIAPLAEALRSQKIVVDVRGLSGVPKSVDELQGFDLFILSDVPALSFTGPQMEAWRSWVQDFGGGFAMLGGEESFGVGGYFRTPIEQMLPVRMEHDDRQETPTVALLVVLDRSGSMAAQAAGQTKISLADRGAVFALNVLQPKDLFGVFAVDSRVHQVVPLGRPDNRTGIEQKIMSITAGGGGIYIYTSLVEAFAALRDVPAKIKHVILFSDAADAEEKSAGEMADGTRVGGSSLDLASAMLVSKVTTSVVALGNATDKDTEFLRQLAERGNGRFYLTSDALTLPQIFSTETMKVAQSSLIEEPFLAVAAGRDPMIAGIDWAQSPLLLGYNATRPKPTAQILLVTERGEPLLATWRHGLGQVAAFTSDAKSRWAGEWLGWPGYGKFWSQVARGLMRKTTPGGLHVTTVQRGESLRVAMDAIAPEGTFRNELPITVRAVDGGGKKQTVAATQEAPGSYSATLELPPEGTTVVSISTGGSDSQDEYVFGHTRSYPREFLTSDTNEAALQKLAAGGGQYAPSPEAIFARPKIAQVQPIELRDYLLIAALVLFPLDIWLRRREFRKATA
jgi:Ca-activated chloride channel family protein